MADTNNKMVKVTNRSSGYVFYEIPNSTGHANRIFAEHEVKMLPMQELIDLAYQPGGRELIYNYLYIEDESVIHDSALNFEEANEYYLEEQDIPGWLNTCTLDEFKDAIEFAPQGVKDLIRSYSVSVPLKDSEKRQVLKDATGFDVSKAIELQRAEEIEPATTAATAETTTGRRTTTTYKKTATTTAAAKPAATTKTTTSK